MSEMARDVTQKVLDADSMKASDRERATAAQSAVAVLAHFLNHKRMVIIDWDEYFIMPREGWVSMTTRFKDSACAGCGRPIAAGEKVYTHPTKRLPNTVVICSECGEYKRKLVAAKHEDICADGRG